MVPMFSLKVNLEKHHFGFGSAVDEDPLLGSDEDSQKYRECYFENFQRAVFHNAHKWRQMEFRRVIIICDTSHTCAEYTCCDFKG